MRPTVGGQLLLEQPVNPLADRSPALVRVVGGFSARGLVDALEAIGFTVVGKRRGLLGLDLLVVAVKAPDR